MNNDRHTHTRFSADSKASMEEYCDKALELGVKTICFTDHMDTNENDMGFGFYDPEGYFSDIKSVRERFRGRLELLSGLEFSEPHLYSGELERLSKYPYDFIMGSVHFFYNDMFPSDMVKRGVSAEDCFLSYWDEVYRMVAHGGFDCVGHLDFPKRYYKTLIYDKEKIKDIIKRMLQNDICLEINTSSLRRGMDTAMPDRDILSIYKSLGGIYVTIGSDAHSASDLASDFKYAKGVIGSLGLKEVIFKNRQRLIV